MATQRKKKDTSNRQKLDEKATARESLQEMFRGSLEPEVVNLILTESDDNATNPANKTVRLPDGKVLVLMRGLPGSGKSTLAQRMKGNGVVFSTDDYFIQNGWYQFDGTNLGEAHQWNQIRAREAMQGGVSPVIIDNTNTQAWEMKPYISMAQRLGYHTIFKEPDTPWRWNARELFKHNQHGITFSGIRNMMERYEHDLTIEQIVNSTNLDKKPTKEKQVSTSELENQSKPKKTQRTETVLPDANPLKSNKEVVEHEKEGNISEKSSQKDVISDERKNQETPNEQHVDPRKMREQGKPSKRKDLPQKKRTVAWKKKTFGDRQEVTALRSHGSRSPVQDMEINTQEEREASTTDSNEHCRPKDEDLENNSTPKPQRSPRRRDRKTTESEQPEVQNKPEIEDLKPQLELKSSIEQNDEKVNLDAESSESSVEVMSEEGSEELQYKEYEESEGQQRQALLSNNEAIRGHGREHVDRSRTLSSSAQSDHKVDKFAKNLQASMSPIMSDNIDLHDNAKATLPSSSDRDSVQNKGLFGDDVGEKIAIQLEGSATTECDNGKSSIALADSKIILPEDQQAFYQKQKVSQESDIDSEVDNRDSSSQISTISVTDDANVGDDEESDDIVEKSDDDDNHGGGDDGASRYHPRNSTPASSLTNSKSMPIYKTREEAEREEKSLSSSQVNSSEDSEPELSGFEFLNTCFPDMDDKILLGILSEHQGDVNKAIEGILNNNEQLLEDTGQNSSLLMCPNNLSSYGSDSSKDEAPLNKLAARASHTSFQMTLEPAIAFHLLELFGPINGFNFEGEFSPTDLSVTVDLEFSKLLYDQWRKSIQKSRGMSPSSSKQRKQRTRLNIHEPLPPPCLNSPKATDLREIMHEQMALEQSRREQEKRESDNNLAVVLKRQKLYAMFPGVDPSALEELFEANNHELAPTVSMVQASCNLQAKPTSLIENEANDESKEGWTLVPGYSGNPEQQQMAYQAINDPGYIDFRGEANMHYKEREECFKKAAFAFSKKQGQLAQFYAAQGHLHTEKIQQAHGRAAARILEHKYVNSLTTLSFYLSPTMFSAR
ncbi:hypothetical protein QZH41_018399 [Actinostola sp. cb2023]|nr:hypothetical protein QZH41_018399 [Actinostola sp. cb2023]